MKLTIENSRALREVWTAKEAIYREVKDLPIDLMLTTIMQKATDNARIMNVKINPAK